MPTTPGPRLILRASAWAHPASGADAVHAFIASHAFNSCLTFVVPEPGGSGFEPAALHPPPPPTFYALRASPAALASPEFAAWAFPDTYGVVEPGEGGAGGGEPAAADGAPAPRSSSGDPPPPPPRPRPAARGASALAVPGCLDSAGAAALLPRGALLLTVPAPAFQRLGLPGVRLKAAERGGRAGALARPRKSRGPHAPPAVPPTSAAWYAVHVPLTGTKRSAAPGGPRAKAADRLARTAGLLDWCLLAPPPERAPASPPSFSCGPPPPHILGLDRVTPVQPTVKSAVLRQAGPPDWEELFFGQQAGGSGGGGTASAVLPDRAAGVAALAWVGVVASAAAGLDPTAAAAVCGGPGAPGAAATTAVHATAWSGFLPPAWASSAVDAARAAVDAGAVPWAAVSVAGFPHAPEAWAPTGRGGRDEAAAGGGGGGLPLNPATPGVRAGCRGRGSGWVVIALPRGRYGLLAASAGAAGLKRV